MKYIHIWIFFLTVVSCPSNAKCTNYLPSKVKVIMAGTKIVNDSLYLLRWVNFKPVFVNSCLENIHLTDLETNISHLYWASNKIVTSSNYQIDANLNITMKAGQMIVLKPKTKILKGSHYLARIEACKNLCSIDIPKGISPNGDNQNDSFDLSGMCHVDECKIFNRYGVIVFEKSHYTNQWHGQDYNDNELPDATYYFCVTLENGETRTGWVYINR